MASIRQRNKSYAVIYYFKDEEGIGRQKWETYHSLESAMKRKEEIENPILFLDISPHISNFKELLDEYVRLHGKLNWSFSMYTNNISLMKRYITPFIGDAKLYQIDAYMMSRFYEKLHKTPPAENKYKPNKRKILSPNTIFEIHQLLRSIFNQSVIWGYFADSPIKHIRLKKPRHPIDILTLEQLITVLNKASFSDPLLFLTIQVAFMASMRKGEIMALK